MFGYIQPFTPQLRVCELDQWKSAYCGLCNALAKRYGHISRYLVNYDLTFLALLLSGVEGGAAIEHGRCPYSPWKKRLVCETTPAFLYAADICLMLAWWRLRDMSADSRFPKSSAYKVAELTFTGKYRRSAIRLPEYDKTAAESMAKLAKIEQESVAAIDPGADVFASMLARASDAARPEHRRSLETLLYHVGRWIYIIDACDDLERDARDGNYNPVGRRFDCTSLGEAERREAAQTLEYSAAMAASAFELLDCGTCTGLLGNILYLGMPAMADKVLKRAVSDLPEQNVRIKE